MSTTRALSAVTALLLALATLLVPVSAHAAEDTVRSLEVALDVAADGTLSVRYDVEWYFGGEFRTAPFIIITREPWDEGGSPKDLVREVSNLQVTTPQGDPVEYEQTGYEAGSHGQVKLRIGDPDSTGRTLRYAVSYDVAVRCAPPTASPNWCTGSPTGATPWWRTSSSPSPATTA
ncbi:hypothetical protein GCM10028820_02510 [Tessaracoccus terricola]